MNNGQEMLSALEQMTSQIELIMEHELTKTTSSFICLGRKLRRIEKKELEETRINLRGLATLFTPIEKNEFSFLRIFRLEDDENIHSNFLAWLLEPSGSHGLGALFSREFLLKATSKTSNLDLSRLNFTGFQVEREISSDKSRLDIRVFDPQGKFQCIIENKIWSSEGIDQTNRLYHDFHDETYPKEMFVFLTLQRESKPKNQHFIPLHYEDILQILTKLLDVADGDTRFLIRHYQNTLWRLIMSEKFEEFSERTKLYYQYYKYIDQVKKAFDKDRKLLLSSLEEAIKLSSWWDDGLWKSKSTGSYINVWKDSWYISDVEGVYFQLYMYISKLGFSITVYSEKPEFSSKFMPIFRQVINEKFPGKMAGDCRKTFSTGVTKFLEKEIRFSPTEKDPISRILKELNAMIKLFDKIIEKSLTELKKK